MIKITQTKQLQILFIFLLFCSTTIIAQVGIGNNNPTTALDVEGSLSLRDGGTITLVNNNNNNVNLPLTSGSVYSIYRITGPTGIFNIGSIVPVTNADGQVVILQNTTNQSMTIRHNAGGTANNRIFVPGGQDLTLTGQYSTVTLSYSTTQNRWILISHDDNAYGNNIVSNTTNVDTSIYAYISVAPFVTMNGMTLTFTPKHSTVYVNFSAAGYISPNINGTSVTTNQTGVYFRLQRIEGATTTTVGHSTSAGTDYDYDDIYGDSVLTGWNTHFTMFPVSVTPGVSTTIRVQWRADTFLGNTHNGGNPTINPIVYCSPGSDTFSHRSITVID